MSNFMIGRDFKKSLNSKFYILNPNKGFSLMELLIYTAVLAIMATVIVSVFLGITRGKGQFTAQSEINSSLRFVIEKINQDIRSASAVSTPASPGGTVSSNLSMTTPEGEVAYCVSSNILRRQVGVNPCDDSSAVVTSGKINVTALTFTRFENINTVFDPDVIAVSIQVSVTMSYAGGGLEYSATKTTTELLP